MAAFSEAGMNVVVYVVGVILAALAMGKIIRERNRAAEKKRDRNYFKRNYD